MNLGNTYLCLGKPEKAVEYHTRALKINKDTYGEDHPQVTTALNSLASSYAGLGEFEKACELQVSSLYVEEKLFGEDHPRVAAILTNLGDSYPIVFFCHEENRKTKKSFLVGEK